MERPGAKNVLVDAINDRSARPVVIGLGHVGLVEAVNYAEAGFQVAGYDINKDHVKAVNEGRSHLHDIEDSRLAKLIESGNLTAYDQPACLRDRDVYIITVPTLLTEEKDPDIRPVENVAAAIKEALSRPALVVLTSTCYPGATRDLLFDPLAKEGFALDEDFWLAYAPARIDPGNPDWPMTKIPKIVSGMTDDSLELGKLFLEQTIEQVIAADSCEAAEMTKLLENSFRLVNMGFMNEMAHVCHELDLDAGDLGRREFAATVASEIVDKLGQPFKLDDDRTVDVSASIGIAIYPDDGTNLDQLVVLADSAMRQAKANGGNRFEFFKKKDAKAA